VGSMGTGIELNAVTKSGARFPVEISLSPIKTTEGLLISTSIRDISQEKIAEERLKEFEYFFNNTKDFSCIANSKGYFEIVNPSFEKVLGHSKNELSEKPFLDFVHPDDIPATLEVYEQLKSGAQVINFINRYRKKDGNYLWFDWNATPNATTGKLYCIARDITERKSAEAKMKQSELLYSTLFYDSPGMKAISETSTGKYLDINHAFANFLERPKEEIVGKTSTDLNMIAQPEGQDRSITQLQELGLVRDLEMQIISASGKKHWVSISADIIKIDGKDCFLSDAVDITKRKEAEHALQKLNEALEQKVIERTEKIRRSEHQYRHLFQNNPMPMWVIDLGNFRFLDVNNMAIQQYGYSRKEFLSMTALDIWPSEDRDAFIKSDHSYLTDSTNYNKGTWTHRKKDGSIIQVEIIAHEIIFEETKAKLILAYDVTEKQLAEEKLAASEMRFRLLIENSADGIDLSDEFSNNIYRSPGAIKITGILPKDNQRSLTHPDDQELIKSKHEELINKPGIPIPFQARFRHALGHYIWLEGMLTNLLHVEGVKAIVTNFRDVTERQKLEDLLRKANTLARIGSWEVDLLKGAVYWNDITREIHEAESSFVPDLATGINFYKEGPGRELITQKINEAIELGEPWDVELQIITAKNNERWIRSIGETEFADGKCVRIYGSFQDIDKRKKVEEALLRSEARARRIFESDMIGFVFWSEKGQILEANDYFLNMTGYTRQDLEKGLVNWAAMTPPEYANLDVISLKQLETTGICKPFEKEYIRKDGSRFPIILGAAALGENFDGVGICYVMDITERKKAEIDRERLNERFQLATQSVQLGLWDWDVKNNKLIWDEAMYRLYNLTENEFTTVYDGWASRVHEEDKQRVDNDIQLALAGKKEYNPEFRIVWPDSSVHYMNASGMIERDDDGKPVRMTGFNWDVTERKKAEEKIKSSEEHYRMLVEQSVDGIFLSDANGQYLDANLSGCKMLGYTWEEIVTMSLADVLTEAEVKRVPELIASFEGGNVSNSEWVFKRKDGSTFIGEVIGRALPDGRLQCILRDITERKAAEEKIKNINIELEEKVISRTEQLRRTNEELEAFSYSVSHDLRAPLRGIIGFTNILEEDYTSKLDDEAKRITAVIKTNTMRMGHLIDDLLAFSRIGRQELIKAPLDTNKLVQEVIEQLKATSKNPDLQWIIEPLPVVNADIGTIRQVWINLVSNAIKYSSNTKHPQITIGHYSEQWQQVFFIKDNGVGFNNEYRHKLFRVFQRLHSAEEFEGTGVGLALVEKIIFKHGGKVWAEAEVNKGASFYFSLPMI
jgi:PAS domain S-box-containing protein